MSPLRTLNQLEMLVPGCGKMNGRAVVVGQVGVQQRRFGARAELRVEDAGQRLVLDLDQVERLLARSPGVSAATAGHRLADVAHAIEREDAAVLEVEPGVAGEVLPGDDHAHARQRLGLAHVDALDDAVRRSGCA